MQQLPRIADQARIQLRHRHGESPSELPYLARNRRLPTAAATTSSASSVTAITALADLSGIRSVSATRPLAQLVERLGCLREYPLEI
jgi:hypothetical protein